MKIENCKLKIAKRKGFTLIELLVGIAIIGILAATTIVNFGKNDDRAVRQEKERLTSFLRETQNKALAIERKGITTTGKVCGFGVRQKDTNKLESFYVSAGIDEDCGANWKDFMNTATAYETFYPSGGTAFTLSGNIFFLSPNGNVECDGCSLPVSITISKGTVNVQAKVNEVGNIY